MPKADESTQLLIDKLHAIEVDANENIEKSLNQEELEVVRIKYLGRKSELTNILKSLKDLPIESKKEIGKEANILKQKLEKNIEKKDQGLISEELSNFSEEKDWIDITLPGEKKAKGHVHPISQMLWLTEDIFSSMGFEIVYPNEVDNDFNNFVSLNLPEGHPARDSWDTFWTTDGQIAITHTSSMQNRILSSRDVPIRAIVPGRCFRNEATDARHEHTFYQVEGIYVDKGITFNHMLGTLKTFFSTFFEKEIEVKFSPDFFPFVEPGGMISLTCVLCNGEGCDVCKKTGWLEILGCGMIHPKVLEMANIDPNSYTGFAWGFGLERLIMLKYDINDVRLFHNGKINFINKF